MEIDEDVDQFRRRVDKFVSDAIVEERPGIGIIEEIVDFEPFRHEVDVGTPQISLRGGTFGGPSGACCDGFDCGIRREADCNNIGGIYKGDNTSCTPNPCATGACCISGTCYENYTMGDCEGTGGEYKGDGTSCSPDPCAKGSCCLGGICYENYSESDCTSTGGTYNGDGSTCTPDPCLGACCFPNGSCDNVPESECTAAGGTFYGFGTSCEVTAPLCRCPCFNVLPLTVTATFTNGGNNTIITLTKKSLSDTGGDCGYSGTDPGSGLTIQISTFTTSSVQYWSGNASASGIGVFWDGNGPTGCDNPYGTYGNISSGTYLVIS